MGSLIQATTLWGYGELVAELGGDPEFFLKRFRIPLGIENQEDAFISIDAYVRLLEASAEDLHCPDFGLRLSRWQGLDILGPIAVIARNAHTLLSGLEMIARYSYIHSPALQLTLAPRTTRSSITFNYEVTEPGLGNVVQGYELSIAILVRIIRLLGGPEARPSAISFMHEQQGPNAAYREALGCPVRGVDSRFPGAWPTDESKARIQRPDALQRNTLKPTIFRQVRCCRSAYPSWPAGCCPPANAASTRSRTSLRCIRGRCNGAWSQRVSGVRT
jgi:hypothetical protein